MVDRLLERPRRVLGTLVVIQLVLIASLTRSIHHNGWVFYQGGDQIISTATGWLLGRLQLPPTEVGYLWPLLQVPITWFTGPTFVQAIPPIVLFNVLVLGPAALIAFYALAATVGGRLIGYWAALLWVVGPFVAIPLFVHRYHPQWVDEFMPQALGLTAMSDYGHPRRR